MTHLTHDELVLFYYSEPGLGARRDHLDVCAECQAELAQLARVLDRVMPLEAPDPGDDYEARVWDRLHWRLRGEKMRQRRTGWMKLAAAAAIVALAFVAGLLWNRRATQPEQVVRTETTAGAPKAATSQDVARDRILLVVVGDHFDDSERMLVELTNLTPEEGDDFSTERERAEELLASNRLYRRTALDRGEERVATLLDELEPVLLEIAHAPDDVSADEIRTMQKRVESKELVFKLRVVRADVRAETPHLQQPNV